MLWFNLAGSSTPHSPSLTPLQQWDGGENRGKKVKSVWVEIKTIQ